MYLYISRKLCTNKYLTLKIKGYPMLTRKYYIWHYKHISVFYSALYIYNLRFVIVKCFWQLTLKRKSLISFQSSLNWRQNHCSLKKNNWSALKLRTSQLAFEEEIIVRYDFATTFYYANTKYNWKKTRINLIWYLVGLRLYM